MQSASSREHNYSPSFLEGIARVDVLYLPRITATAGARGCAGRSEARRRNGKAREEDNVILDNLFQDASRKKSFARGNLVRAVCSPIRRRA